VRDEFVTTPRDDAGLANPTSPRRATIARLFSEAHLLNADPVGVELRTPGRPDGGSDHDPPIRQRLPDEVAPLGDSYYPSTIVQNLKIMNPADIKEGTDQILETSGIFQPATRTKSPGVCRHQMKRKN
jgi:hypothetical protein